ncbi:MAG: hypothetical protein RIC95_11120 [Vicingaceae bacterium]
MESQDFLLLKELSFASVGRHSSLPILYTRFLEQVSLGHEDAMELVSITLPIIKKHQLIYGIADNRADFISLNSDAMNLLSDNESLALLKAQAAITSNVATQISANYFVKARKPIIPFEVFDSIEPAISWLLKQK